MKVLFVCSGNKTGEPGIVVYNQGESLRKQGVDVDYFTIKGKGVWGYLKNIPKVIQIVRNGSYDIVHSHFSLSAFVASFVMRKPLVVSLMGSDAYQSFVFRMVSRLLYRFRWDATIVKEPRMRNQLHMPNALVIPNGVDFSRFCPMPKDVARQRIGYLSNQKLIVFVSDPNRKEKNYDLARESVEKAHKFSVELMPVYNVPNEDIPFYLNAADILLLTSDWEGSVNVVKEAMACNLPIVSKDVGDVKTNLEGVSGCVVCEGTSDSLAYSIETVLGIDRKTKGRERLVELGLDSESIAIKLKNVYGKLVAK